MSDDLAFPYRDFYYIKLIPGEKNPLEPWGGYGTDPAEAVDRDDPEINVYTHEDVLASDHKHWGIVGIKNLEHTARSLLIYDIDLHKSPNFDPDRIAVDRDDVPIIRSQSGGLHGYTAVLEPRASGSESDFSVVPELPFDIDIRGSFVKQHVVAPKEIPGIGGDYSVVNDVELRSFLNVRDTLERFEFDGSDPLLDYQSGSGVGDFTFERSGDPPKDMPACYHAGLQLRAANPDEHPNTHKVNTLTGMCGLAAGYSIDEMVDHFCDEFPPGESGDRQKTRYHLKHMAEKFDRGSLAPPAVSTLRGWGILGDDETCNCEIDYHGSSGAGFAASVRAAGASETERATDGGTDTMSTDTTASGGSMTGEQSLQQRVEDLLLAYEADDDMPQRTVIHEAAVAITEEHHFAHPPEAAEAWRSVLYRYDDSEGVYVPDGERFVQELAERLLGAFLTNQQTNELVGKIKRLSGVSADDLDTAPNRLVVGNGILDLKTGELDPWTPDEYHRTKNYREYHPDAECPKIDEFFRSLVKLKDVPTLYQLAAHSLYKEYVGEKAAMLVGDGENGKSVFLDVLEHFLGGSNVSHRSLQDLDGRQFAANNLEGKLANFHPDMEDEKVQNLGTFKKLTGRDGFDADVKFEKPISFENYATMIFSANRIPAMDEDTHALWRRWIYLKFPNTFEKGSENYRRKDDLMAEVTAESELEGLLARCVEEIKAWDDGREWFTNIDTPEQVREKMKRASEPVYNFATVCLERAEDNSIPKDMVRKCYRAYAREEDLPTIPANQFGEKVMNIRDFPIETGQPRIDGKQVHAYTGVQFTSRGRQVLELDGTDDSAQAGVTDGGPEQWKYDMIEAMQDLGGRDSPVTKDMAIGYAVANGLEMDQAEHAFGDLKDTGTVYPPADAEDGKYMLSS